MVHLPFHFWFGVFGIFHILWEIWIMNEYEWPSWFSFSNRMDKCSTIDWVDLIKPSAHYKINCHSVQIWLVVSPLVVIMLMHILLNLWLCVIYKIILLYIVRKNGKRTVFWGDVRTSCACLFQFHLSVVILLKFWPFCPKLENQLVKHTKEQQCDAVTSKGTSRVNMIGLMIRLDNAVVWKCLL